MYILVQFNSTLPLARYAQSHYALLVHWGNALHRLSNSVCFQYQISHLMIFLGFANFS
jgi:hypothetical protein